MIQKWSFSILKNNQYSNKILLTGATGFIGRGVTSELIKRGYTIYAPSTSISLPETEGLIQVKLDLFDKNAVEEYLKQNEFDNLIHLAWYLGPNVEFSDLNLDWIGVSLHLLKTFKKYGGKRILFAGSMSEYDYAYGYCKEHLTPLNNYTLYGKCKANLFHVVSDYTQQEGLDLKWARIFNVYGPYEKSSRLMPSVIRSILNNEDIKVSSCERYQSYLHVFDMADALASFFESNVQGPVNISSGIPVKLKDIVEKIAELMEYKGEISYGAIPPNFENFLVVGSNEKLIKEVGWTPKIDLESGLKQTIDWWRKNEM